MTIERKFTALLIPFQAYCALALLGLLFCRTAYGHEADVPMIKFLAWSSIASSFFWLIGAAIQAHFRFTGLAIANAVIAIASIFAAAHLLPYLAR